MKQTIEVSRTSIKMTIMAISADVIPKRAHNIVLAIVEKKLEAILAHCPDQTFRVTVATLNEPESEDCQCRDIMSKDESRHFRGCPKRVGDGA